MSILMAGGRSASARRFSQAASSGTNYQSPWASLSTIHRESVSSILLRRESASLKGRRRALDLYGTKDVLFTHEQVKRAKRSLGSSAAFSSFGWVSSINKDCFFKRQYFMRKLE